MCVFAGTVNALIADATLPPRPAWSAVGSKGYKFKGFSPDGLSLALLKGGAAGKSKAVAKGKGQALPDTVLPVAYPLVIGFFNATIGLVLKIVTFPLTIVTLGLFLFVVNAIVLMLASKLVEGFSVASFASAFLAAIVLAIVHLVLRRLAFA